MQKVAFTLASLLALACSSSLDRSEPAAASVEGPVIAIVALEDERLTVRASADGPRFDVATHDGRALSRDLDLGELAARHRDLYDLYRYSYARTSDDEPFLDARRD